MSKKFEDLFGELAEMTNDHVNILVSMIGNQRQAIYELAEIIGDIPGADKSKLAAMVKGLDEFDPMAKVS